MTKRLRDYNFTVGHLPLGANNAVTSRVGRDCPIVSG